MRPQQYLKESVAEIKLMYHYAIITLAEYKHRLGMIIERYKQKMELRKSFKSDSKNSKKGFAKGGYVNPPMPIREEEIWWKEEIIISKKKSR